MGANTYRIMSNYYAAEGEPGLDVCDGIDDEWSGHRCVSSLPAPTGEPSDPDVDPPPSRGELPACRISAPVLLAFHIYVTDDESFGVFVQIHPDAELLQHHLQELGEKGTCDRRVPHHSVRGVRRRRSRGGRNARTWRARWLKGSAHDLNLRRTPSRGRQNVDLNSPPHVAGLGSVRVAGSFAGPIGEMVSAGDWSMSVARDQLTVFEVERV